MKQKQYSRTQYSVKNTTIAVATKVSVILLGYLTRVVFLRVMSESFVGINGLFTGILNTLALSELGIETAIIYALYRPIADHNIEAQKAILKIYRRFYQSVAAILLVLGLCVVPFLPVIVKTNHQIAHLTLYYLLYLFNLVLSYLFIYKRTVADASQMLYIGTIYRSMAWIVQDILQIMLLLLTHNMMLYLLVSIAATSIGNILASRKTAKLFPYVNEKEVNSLSKEESRQIMKNCRAMMMHKVGTVIVNNTDYVLLSALIGIVCVGRYSNYYLLIGSVQQVLCQVFLGITTSVGNLGATENKKHMEEVLNTTFFIGQWLFGFAAICIYELIDPFVEISFGSNYVFSKDIVLILCINFFLTGMRRAVIIFRDSLGIFWTDRYKAIAEVLLNLIFSVILVKYYGAAGIFLGAVLSNLLTSVWIEPYVLYHSHLNQNCKNYFIRFGCYTVVSALAWYVTDLVCRQVTGQMTGSLLGVLVVRLLVCLVIPNVIMLVIYCKNEEFRKVIARVNMIRKNKMGGQKG